jgi:hypothetical protein
MAEQTEISDIATPMLAGVAPNVRSSSASIGTSLLIEAAVRTE